MGAEAFARASVRWAQVRDFAVPEQWVRRVAMNLAVDGLRRARRRLAALARLGPGPVAPPISVDRVTLAEALRTLPRSYRQVLVLHHLLELPVEQVARELGIPTGTVKGRLSRGRRALAARLCDRAIMSRFTGVQRIAPSVVLAGQVNCPVYLVASCLAGYPWWNDHRNDLRRSLRISSRRSNLAGLQAAGSGDLRAPR
jgi:RNA polymerase sigma-70 factor (ECF subfamily)